MSRLLLLEPAAASPQVASSGDPSTPSQLPDRGRVSITEALREEVEAINRRWRESGGKTTREPRRDDLQRDHDEHLQGDVFQ